MTVHYEDARVTLHHGDCLDVLRELPDASVDSVVTDPPYGLEFMGKSWDSFGRDSGPGYAETPRFTDRGDASPLARTSGPNHFRAGAPFQRWCEEWAAECLRVLKPGGHMLAFGGTRTWHRLACAVEDAGFEVRDSIAWLYGSGFPKSLDVSKAIDKAAGAERTEVVGRGWHTSSGTSTNAVGNFAETYQPGDAAIGRPVTAPATDAAREWAGWGTALKPAFEPVVVARKPLTGTVAANVLEHGTGALNIDATRIGTDEKIQTAAGSTSGAWIGPVVASEYQHGTGREYRTGGRWPANVALDESQAAALDEQSGTSKSRIGKPRGAASGDGWGMTATGAEYDDTGGASRFFYVAKAPKHERPVIDGVAHPTVKPLTLMRRLVRLVTPPGGTVLEPFAGSGTTVEACIAEGVKCIAIEKGDEYLPLILERIRRQDAERIADEVTRRPDPTAAIAEQVIELGLFDLDPIEGTA